MLSTVIITILNVQIKIHNNFNSNHICINSIKKTSHGAEKGKMKGFFPSNLEFVFY